MRRTALLALLALAGPAGAADLPLPAGAVLAAEETEPAALAALPTGPWAGGPPPVTEAEGTLTRRAYTVPRSALTADQLLAPLRDALEAEGFSVLYACADRACGGYDFRFGLDLLPAPAMFVDLGNYRYLLAEASSEHGRRLASVVTSTGLGQGFVHITTLDPAAEPPPAPLRELQGPPAPDATAVAAPPAGAAPAPDSLAARLLAHGHVILDGLDFPSGSASLPADRYESLAELAAFLAEAPAATIVLVGHTDATGALAPNVAISRARAEAVRARLIGTHGADGNRIAAEGAGWLAPVASNLTPEGQAANRRVEAVLLTAP
jgi:outer membrane protein OmpA-like peptidoglycan-associated protein